ncbi:hypothetical protein ACOME3_006210 [Neoechinorhynchus agilis]
MNPEIIEVLQEILAQVDNKLENAERERSTTEQIDLTDIKIIDGHDSEPKVNQGLEISRQGLLDVELKETNETLAERLSGLKMLLNVSKIANVSVKCVLNDDSVTSIDAKKAGKIKIENRVDGAVEIHTDIEDTKKRVKQNPELEDKTGDTGDIRCCIKCGMSEISKLFDYCGLCLCEKCIEASIPKDQTNIAVKQRQGQNEDNFNEAFNKRTIEPTKRKHPETSSTRAKRAKVQRQCNRCKVVVSRIRYRRNDLYYCKSCAIIEGFLDAKTSSAVKTKKAVMRTGDLKCSSIKQGQKSLKRGVPLDQIEQQPRTKSRRTRMQESSTLNRSATEPLKPSPFLEETLQTLGRLINLSSAQSELIQQSNKLTSNVPSMNWTPTLNSMLISAARISAEVQAEKDRSEKQSEKD